MKGGLPNKDEARKKLQRFYFILNADKAWVRGWVDGFWKSPSPVNCECELRTELVSQRSLLKIIQYPLPRTRMYSLQRRFPILNNDRSKLFAELRFAWCDKNLRRICLQAQILKRILHRVVRRVGPRRVRGRSRNGLRRIWCRIESWRVFKTYLWI